MATLHAEDTGAAIARSNAGLSLEQAEALDRAIEYAASNLTTFSANDVWQFVPDELVPRNRRSLGARIKAAESRGLIAQVKDRVVSDLAHGQTVAKWRGVQA